MTENSDGDSGREPGPLLLGREPVVLSEERKKAMMEIRRRVKNVRE